MAFSRSRRGRKAGVLGVLVLLCLLVAALGGSAPVGADPGGKGTTEAFAAAAQAEPESEERVVGPRAIPAAFAAARAATFGFRQLARTPAFRQQVSEVTRNAGLFRQVAGFFGFGAAAAAKSGPPADVDRIFDD